MADFTPAARNFLDHHCAECHDADVQKGNLRVDQLSVAEPNLDQFNLLVLLFDRVLQGRELARRRWRGRSPTSASAAAS